MVSIKELMTRNWYSLGHQKESTFQFWKKIIITKTHGTEVYNNFSLTVGVFLNYQYFTIRYTQLKMVKIYPHFAISLTVSLSSCGPKYLCSYLRPELCIWDKFLIVLRLYYLQCVCKIFNTYVSSSDTAIQLTCTLTGSRWCLSTWVPAIWLGNWDEPKR